MGAFAANRLSQHFGLKDGRFQSLTFPMIIPTSYTTAQNGANVNYSSAALLGGFILRNPTTTGLKDNFPTAANLVAAVPGCMVGTSFEVMIRNQAASGTNAIGFAATAQLPPGVTIDNASTPSINGGSIGTYMILFTNVTPGLEAYTVYSLGTTVF